MSNAMPKAIKVTIEYDNGLEVQSVDEHAQAFMEAAEFSYPIKEAKQLRRLERIPEKKGGRVGLSVTEIKATVIKALRTYQEEK